MGKKINLPWWSLVEVSHQLRISNASTINIYVKSRQMDYSLYTELFLHKTVKIVMNSCVGYEPLWIAKQTDLFLSCALWKSHKQDNSWRYSELPEQLAFTSTAATLSGASGHPPCDHIQIPCNTLNIITLKVTQTWLVRWLYRGRGSVWAPKIHTVKGENWIILVVPWFPCILWWHTPPGPPPHNKYNVTYFLKTMTPLRRKHPHSWSFFPWALLCHPLHIFNLYWKSLLGPRM